MKHIVMLLLYLVVGSVSAHTIEVPLLTQRVMDVSQILTPDEHHHLTRQLENLETQTHVQMAVLILPTTGSDSIEQFATRVFEQWKLGSKEQNNGVLFLIALNDHRMRFEVGYGLEGELTDIQTGRILRNDVGPAFKQEDYYAGISLGINAITLLLNGQPISNEVGDMGSVAANSGDIINIGSLKFVFWFLGMILLPNLVFRRRTLFGRASMCGLTIAVSALLMDLMGAAPVSNFMSYFSVFLISTFILMMFFAFAAAFTGRQLVGTAKISNSGSRNSRRKRRRKSDGVSVSSSSGSDFYDGGSSSSSSGNDFSGGGGSSGGGGASDRW
ncbi:hypothetical protein Ppb6_00357 [Photorhabdus australis subsp. thailandensis]|uniref:TPM domain-containing protein n=1 Tax=Photorhabdus australis subsp. thailandensis TaxID=2805096 RepID=A0A1C0U999_9GAMM|nr:YgcG family protein [Photorhabdus australis]OCQ54455.1 hypothetical protein Ppb6_00357 [Photorhabdus australis subsp. thailandensis]